MDGAPRNAADDHEEGLANEPRDLKYLCGGSYLVANINGFHTEIGRRVGNLLTVFIGARHKISWVRSLESLKASNHIGCCCFIGVAHMGRTIGIVNGRCNIKASTSAFFGCVGKDPRAVRLAQMAIDDFRFVTQRL